MRGYLVSLPLVGRVLPEANSSLVALTRTKTPQTRRLVKTSLGELNSWKHPLFFALVLHHASILLLVSKHEVE